MTEEGVTGDGIRLERNLRILPIYLVLFGLFFWVPVFFLYFSSRLSLEKVLQLEAIYYGAVVLLEVPSGYLSDRIGRKPTLVLSSICLAIAYGFFYLATGFLTLALAQVFLAAGIACYSGTETAFHYDTLAALGRSHEYGQREARFARVGFLSGAVAALVGGAVGIVDLRLPYLLSFVVSVLAVIVALCFVEPGGTHEARKRRAESFFRQMLACVRLLRDPRLAWLFSLSILVIVLIHIPWEFYQPYLDLLDLRILASGDDEQVPLIAGLHVATALMLGSWLAGKSIAIRDRIGTKATLLLSVFSTLVIVTGLGLTLSIVGACLAVLRSVPRALFTAPQRAAITPRIEEHQRATYLSLQSLAGRLSFSLTLIGLSVIAGTDAQPTWDQLSRLCLVATVLGAVGCGVLLVWSRYVDIDGGGVGSSERKPSRETRRSGRREDSSSTG